MFASILALGFAACSDDKPDGETIFPTTAPQRDAFDEWVLKNFTYPYNVQFMYKWKDIEADDSYTLVPADSAKSAKLAIIVKHLWFDSYNEVCGQDFLKLNVPRIITLIGSPAYNSNNTMVMGTAEGGYKVVLYMVNNLTAATINNYQVLTQYYFTTMHHEFMHILNQKKPYDTEFDLITEADYVSGDWYQVNNNDAYKKGFVRNYAMVEGKEDFAETYCQYVTNTDAEWQAKLNAAGADGKAIILQKVAMIRSYLKESWNYDIDELRAVVLRRGQELSTLDLEHLN